MRLSFAILALFCLAPANAGVPEDVRVRRRAIEREFAARYMEVAAEGRKARDADLAMEAFKRAEALDPGNDAVLAFEPPAGNGKVKVDGGRAGPLRRKLDVIRLAEAKERFALAKWCDDEAWAEEAVEEARAALALAPGPLAYDEEGVLTDADLGALPKSLSISVLDGHEIWKGRLTPIAEVPEQVAWADGWSVTTAHFLVKTNVSGSLCRLVGRTLEAARVVYREETGFDVTTQIKVFVLARRGAFEEYHVKLGKPKPERENIGKCWGDFCLVDGSRSSSEVLATAVHEVAHGYLNLALEALTKVKGAGVPTWLTEGLATFCAGFGEGSRSFDQGVLNPEKAKKPSLRRFQELVRVRESRPLAEFLKMDTCDSRFYYQAFAFYWFFREGASEEVRARFRRAVARIEKAGFADSVTARGNEIFLEEMGEIAGLDAAFYEWVSSVDTTG